MDECQLNSQTMRNQIARALRRNPRVTRGLVRARDSELLPEEAFSWVEKSGRQPKWLAAQAGNKTGLRIRSSVFRTLTDREQLIALFDLWDRDFGQKESALKRLSDAWTEHARSDRIFSWFKDKDERTKCALAWSWLEKNKPRLTWRAEPFTKLTELLEFFDHSGASDEEKELYVDKIKRRWSTQKTREKAVEKKQYNFVLPLSVNALLDKLAEEHQLSRTKVLEMLILGEEQHELYLPKQPSR
ncbi:hypothetical protein PALA39_02332 [Pseudomonas aeruginosa]|jgi:hypothetical protein|nr:hypothetical protein PALA39_02332 [Pseudomonas aeruginosa]CFU81033.1 hypothetical protein PARN21_2458 [Pseudomonas aeruginosa]SUC56389.1 Uncharacterised protein [Pseudomonas aeruginosa]